jgi:hypothetical protein
LKYGICQVFCCFPCDIVLILAPFLSMLLVSFHSESSLTTRTVRIYEWLAHFGLRFLILEDHMGYSTPTGASMQSCIDACDRCHRVCFQTAMNHCLEMGGKHVEPEHFRLMINCAEICQTSVNFQLSNSRFQYRLCEVCAEICEACAMDCEKIGGMDECVEVCRECAKSCREMASTQH